MVRCTAFAGWFAALLASPVQAAATDAAYPSRAVTIVVNVPPGGTADTLARVVADKLHAILGQSFIVENRGGGGGNIGAELVAKAPADGYTLLCAPQGTYSVAHLLYPKLAFDPRALEPVSVIAKYPTVVVARSGLPVDDMAQLVAYARANPGKINYASQGKGQIGHLAFEMLKKMANVDMVHVPYRGSAPALNDMLGGQVDVMADTLLATAAHVRAGKLKLIGVGSSKRLDAFPQVQAVAEVVPGFEAVTWMAIGAPPGTPNEIARKLSAAIAQAVHMPDVTARISDLQAEPYGSSPDEMADLVRQSTERWQPVIVAAKISID
jgi:tripartite-type tricarboxylate transporter receptor subunit TctC